MEFSSLPSAISKLIAEKRLEEAEQLLSEAQRKAELEKDSSALHYILSELVELYGISDPPLWTKAETLSVERERLAASAYSKLQTAMILHRGVGSHVRAVPKLQEAITLANSEHDDRTLYASLSLLGEAWLALGETAQAMAVFDQLESVVENKRRIVIGDETCFLEELKARRVEVERVRRLAATLASICRDPAFAKRLRILASI